MHRIHTDQNPGVNEEVYVKKFLGYNSGIILGSFSRYYLEEMIDLILGKILIYY